MTEYEIEYRVTLQFSLRHGPEDTGWATRLLQLGVQPHERRVAFSASTPEKAMELMWRAVNNRGLFVHRFDMKLH